MIHQNAPINKAFTGVGNRMLIVDTNGLESTQALPEITALTNATVNSSYPSGSYSFNALTTDGYPVSGLLSGKRNGTLNAQRLQDYNNVDTYLRYWIEATPAWSAWSKFSDGSDYTAKGQILVSTASNAFSALGIGANESILTADSTQAMGVKWSAVLRAAMIAASAAISTTETILSSLAIAANTFIVGRTYKIKIFGTCTSTIANVSNIRVRIGTAGTVADAVAAVITPTAAASGTANPFEAEITITIRTTGTTGTAVGMGKLVNNGIIGISGVATVVGPATVPTINTTVANTISVTYSSAATTTASTFQIVVIHGI